MIRVNGACRNELAMAASPLILFCLGLTALLNGWTLIMR